ncbi:MAG: peptide chain release factor N(5)-glutamine methyltransferase [Metamycoplasmataceae bacterium]
MEENKKQKKTKKPMKVIKIIDENDRKYTSLVDEYRRSKVIYVIKKFRRKINFDFFYLFFFSDKKPKFLSPKINSDQLWDSFILAFKRTFKIKRELEKDLEFGLKTKGIFTKYKIENFLPEDYYLLVSWKNGNDKYWLEYRIYPNKPKIKIREIIKREKTIWGLSDNAGMFLYKLAFNKNMRNFCDSIRYYYDDEFKKYMDRIDEFSKEKRKYNLDPYVILKERLKIKRNMPFQKVIGYIEMQDVKINVSKKVLIPRYETEELIILIKKIIDPTKINNVLDLCTGSGFIALALKKKYNNWNVYASDISYQSKKQVLINQKINKLNINFYKSDLFNKINNKFDLIVSNPPYISLEEYKTLDLSVTKFEPKIALTDSGDGLIYYKKIIDQYKNFLNLNGYLFFEINPLNVSFFINQGFTIVKDINDKERFAFIQKTK